MVQQFIIKEEPGFVTVRTSRGGGTERLTFQEFNEAIELAESDVRKGGGGLAFYGRSPQVRAFGSFLSADFLARGVIAQRGALASQLRRGGSTESFESLSQQPLSTLKSKAREQNPFFGTSIQGLDPGETFSVTKSRGGEVFAQGSVTAPGGSSINIRDVAPQELPGVVSQTIVEDIIQGRKTPDEPSPDFFSRERQQGRRDLANQFILERIRPGRSRGFLQAVETRESFLQEKTGEGLTADFQGLTEEQLQSRAGVEGSGITSKTTEKGTQFIFQPTEEQIKTKRGEALTEFKELPFFEKRKAEIRDVGLGVSRTGVGVVEFIPDLPSLFGGGFIETEESGKIGRSGDIISERKLVKELRAKPVGLLGKGAEIASTVAVILVPMGGLFSSARAAGLTRSQAAGEVASGLSLIQPKFSRVVAPIPTKFKGRSGDIIVGEGGVRTQIVEARGVDVPDFTIRAFGMGKGDKIAGFTIREMPETRIGVDIFEGVQIKTGTVTDILPFGSKPLGSELGPARGIDPQTPTFGTIFEKSRLTESFVPRKFAEVGVFEGFGTGRTTATFRTFPGEPLVPSRTQVGVNLGRKTSGKIGDKKVELEEFLFGAGEPVVTSQRVPPSEFKVFGGRGPFEIGVTETRQPVPRATEPEFLSTFSGEGLRLRVTKAPKGDETTFIRGRGRRGRTTQDLAQQDVKLTQELLGATIVAAKPTSPKVITSPLQLSWLDFPLIVGGTGKQGLFTGLGTHEISDVIGGRLISPAKGQTSVQLPKTSFDKNILGFRQSFGQLDRGFERQNILLGTMPRFAQAPKSGFRQRELLLTSQATSQSSRAGLTFDVTQPIFTFGDFGKPFRPQRGRGFLPFFFPGLGMAREKRRKKKPKRKFKRQISLISAITGSTTPRIDPREITGLVERKIIRRKR